MMTTETFTGIPTQGYYTVCPICLKEIWVNYEGQEMGTAKHSCTHECIKHRRYIGDGRYECRICGSIA